MRSFQPSLVHPVPIPVQGRSLFCSLSLTRSLLKPATEAPALLCASSAQPPDKFLRDGEREGEREREREREREEKKGEERERDARTPKLEAL